MGTDESVKSIQFMQEIIATLASIPLTPAEITALAGVKTQASYYAWRAGRSAPGNKAIVRLQYVVDTAMYVTSVYGTNFQSALVYDYFKSLHTALGNISAFEFIRRHGNCEPDKIRQSVREFLN
ncbi:MAG: hypothetical protein NVS3B29_03330 [Candidatus Saccharimonadales bacterium]